MSWNFLAPQVEGLAARQAHADIPENSFEREIGRDGFFGAATHMYHRNPPTAWSSVTGPICPRALNPTQAATVTDSPWDAMALVGNAHMRMRYWRSARAMDHLVRNADGDDLLFVHAGSGEFFCDYGHLSYRDGDYLVIPRGTMWRIEPNSLTDLLMVEATGGNYGLPDRGILGRHAIFDPGVLERPALDDRFRAQATGGPWTVAVKRGGKLGQVTFPFNPLDAMGWKGDLHPIRLSMTDIRPVVSARLHLPPSVRSTFVSQRFVVCTLVPRPLETDPGAIKLPFFHSNDDYDEVIFFHKGEMGSRGKVVGPGMMTFHPSGITHGPHPEVLPFMHTHPAKSFDNYSVMIDALDPLEIEPLPAGAEVAGYAETWRASIARAPDARPAVLEPVR